MTHQWSIRVALVVVLGFLFGCAGSSMFTTYPSRLEPVRAGIVTGDTEKPEESLKDILDSSNVSDRVLYLQEHGRVTQIGDNDVDDSIESYSEAIAIVVERDQAALVTSSDVGSTIASIATSDNAIPYEPPPHERAFLRTFQASNYLQKGEVEGARVEIMNFQNEQEKIRERLDAERDELEAELAAKGKDGSAPTKEEIETARQKRRAVSSIGSNAKFGSARNDMISEVANLRNSSENAYSYYVSGLVYELNDGEEDQDNALTSYTKALEIAPNNPYLIESAYRLANELDTWKPALRKHKKARAGAPLAPVPEGSGRVVILHEQGFVIPRSQVKFPVVVSGTMYNIALPYYGKSDSPPRPVKVFIDEEDRGATAPLVDVRKLAVKHLVDDYHNILIRQALRLAAKAAAQMGLEKSGVPFVGTAFGVVDFFVTSADMRTWLTLPAYIQLASFDVPAGERKIQLQEADGQVIDLGKIDVKEGKITVIRSIEMIGPSTYTDTLASN